MDRNAEKKPDDAGPLIRVGLFENRAGLRLQLHGDFIDADGQVFAGGDYRGWRDDKALQISGPQDWRGKRLQLEPLRPKHSFSVETTIGVDFHWQQDQLQRFAGALELYPGRKDGLSLINRLPLEDYLRSVICSEMNADAPPDLLRAHAVISRSWLLAQINPVIVSPPPPGDDGETLVQWYDRAAHQDFDVCADDHCQRYQGLDRIEGNAALAAVDETRGLALFYDDKVCDARFSKCCGGVTEKFSSAWADVDVPYLRELRDDEGEQLFSTPLSDERAFRAYVDDPPAAFCDCQDQALLDKILPGFDRKTPDFFRWQVRLSADEASALVERKLGLGLGRLLRIEPVQRSLSGRLTALRLIGEKGQRVIGKELEIRRALAASHLYSSALYVVSHGPQDRPEAFELRGAGWGHGVGLCQIGAAVMASHGYSYQKILQHYYPGAQLKDNITQAQDTSQTDRSAI